MDIGHLVRLIEENSDLTEAEKRVLVEHLLRSLRQADTTAIPDSDLPVLLPQIRSGGGLFEFCRSAPGIRRWFLARLTSNLGSEPGAEERFCVDLCFSSATPLLRERLAQALGADYRAREAARYFHELEADRLEWWTDEDYESTAHLDRDDFSMILMELANFPRETQLEEGMVFVEISSAAGESSDWSDVRFVNFSRQSRALCKEIMSRLIAEGHREGGGNETA